MNACGQRALPCECLASKQLYGGEIGTLSESGARALLRAGSLDTARDRIFEAGQQSLIAAQPGVFSAARPPSRAQALAARGIRGGSFVSARFHGRHLSPMIWKQRGTRRQRFDRTRLIGNDWIKLRRHKESSIPAGSK
jgi:hypothetical protein